MKTADDAEQFAGVFGARRDPVKTIAVAVRRWDNASLKVALPCSIAVDTHTWNLALNTLLLTAAACAIAVPLGTLVAFLLARTDLPGRRAGMAVVGVMLFVPLYLQAAAWQAGFGLSGWYTLALGTPAWVDGWTGAVWVHAMAGLPWVVLIVGIGLRLIEPELEEQALLDGSPAQVLFRVTLRGALPAVGVAALWVAIVTAGEMTVTDLFVVRTYAEVLYVQFAEGRQPGEAALAAMPGVLLTAVLVAAGLAVCARLAPRGRPISFRRRWGFRLGRWRAPAAILTALLLVLLIGVPVSNLCYKAGVIVTQVDAERVRSWSPGKCLTVVAESPWRYRREFGWSLLIGSLAATAAVTAATALAWVARGGRRGAVGTLLIAAVCLALPGPVIGAGLIQLLNRPEVPGMVFLYDRSILAPWLAMTIRGLPLATLVMWHALRTVPREMLDSAAVDGAGPLTQLLQIALPCRKAAAALAWIVAMAVALGDLGASILVAPPGVRTLSTSIFDLLHSSVEDQVAGICLALILLFAAVTAVAAWLVRTMGGENRI